MIFLSNTSYGELTPRIHSSDLYFRYGLDFCKRLLP